jgi:hypothetical protein
MALCRAGPPGLTDIICRTRDPAAHAFFMRWIMRIPQTLAVLAVVGTAAIALPARAEDAFDACTVFTADDAGKAMGAPATGEPANPKVKRPKVVLTCTYTGSKEGKPVSANVQFKFHANNDAALKAFDESRLQLQTKPMLMTGADAFWSGKTGQMFLRKGKAMVIVQVGSPKVNERDVGDAKKLSEILVKKL